MSCLVAPPEELLKKQAALMVDGNKFSYCSCDNDGGLKVINGRCLRPGWMFQPVDDSIELEFLIVRLQGLKKMRVVCVREDTFTGRSKGDGTV